MIKARLKKLEELMRTKFCNSYDTVRKAFLALDSDYDGYINLEDLFKWFSSEKDISYDDLKKLIIDKDSKKQGRINYADFSRWLGSSIHQSEGFYFRHDSKKNPIYDTNLRKFNKTADLMNEAGILQQDELRT